MPVAPLLRVRIGGTGSSTPGRRVSTAEYVTRVTPRRDAAEVEARTGIATRYVARTHCGGRWTPRACRRQCCGG
jgi:3-oxoacyl-[acyl-carrier-protein] synthase III